LLPALAAEMKSAQVESNTTYHDLCKATFLFIQDGLKK